MIDFGCGKAKYYFENIKINNINYKNIAHFWKIQKYFLYDPGVKSFSKYPSEKADGVICTDVVEKLRDSLRIGNDLIHNLESHNIMLMHQGAVLVDSTRKNLLKEEVSKTKQNEAMRHLSRSLRYYYDQSYCVDDMISLYL